jgi:hypothetical protein
MIESLQNLDQSEHEEGIEHASCDGVTPRIQLMERVWLEGARRIAVADMGVEEIALRSRAEEILIDRLGHQTIGVGLAAHEGDDQLRSAFLIGDVTDHG